MTRKPTTVYLDRDMYDRLKELVAPKPVSQELNELIAKRIAELEGGKYDPLESADYEAVKREYMKLHKEEEKIVKQLKKRKTWNPLVISARKYGLDEEALSNIDAVSAEMLQNRDAPKEDTHLFISFLELAKKRKEAEKKLEQIRLSQPTY